jgi:CRISPR/Cas system CSM-associated protein Csm4 (group 5 of RAMP superfamily)
LPFVRRCQIANRGSHLQHAKFLLDKTFYDADRVFSDQLLLIGNDFLVVPKTLYIFNELETNKTIALNAKKATAKVTRKLRNPILSISLSSPNFLAAVD